MVTARSSIHDTTCVWSKLEGSIEVDPADPGAGAVAELRVDMRVFDAGDRLKNWKLKGDLEPDKHPTAVFRLARLADVRPGAAGDLQAAAAGALSWRGRTTQITAPGSGHLDPTSLSADATFELDVRTLGVTPPKILMFKVESVVLIKVSLRAQALPP